MIISIPCSRKVFNIWMTIIIIACFCNKHPGPIVGIFAIIAWIFLSQIRKHRVKAIVNQAIAQEQETGLVSEIMINSIACQVVDYLKNLDNLALNSFNSVLDFEKSTIEQVYSISFEKILARAYSIDEIKPTVKYIEKQIAFIKSQMNENNQDILMNQLVALFILLVYCYNVFYKDLNFMVGTILKKLN